MFMLRIIWKKCDSLCNYNVLRHNTNHSITITSIMCIYNRKLHLSALKFNSPQKPSLGTSSPSTELIKKKMEVKETRVSRTDSLRMRVNYMRDYVTGKQLMEWYSATPPHRRPNLIISWFLKQFYRIGIIVLIYGIYIFMRWKTHPMTGRETIETFSKTLLDNINELKFWDIFRRYEHHIVKEDDERFRRVQHVIDRILTVNADIDEIGDCDWKLVVFDHPSVDAVHALQPTGHVMVFSAMIDRCETDDQLAYVLSHSIAHTILEHDMEMSKIAKGIKAYQIALWTLWWTLNYNCQSADRNEMSFYEKKIYQLSQKCPFSEVYEHEADRIALQLMTRACFDVRHVITFWEKNCHNVPSDKCQIDEQYFGIHSPGGHTRLHYVQQLIPFYLLLREECKCPPLPKQ